MIEDRSISEVVRDLLRNVQDMFRAEVRLAKAEIRKEATHAASSAVWVIAGVVVALTACTFLLWTTAYALATQMPMWAATLVIAVVMAVAGSVLIVTGSRQFKRVKAIPGRTGTVAEGESRMDEATHEIEARIDRARERLGSNLRELERKVDVATDWREQFRARPHMFLGAACAGGALLAALSRLKSSRRVLDASQAAHLGPVSRSGVNVQQQALELWDDITGALIGVTSTRIKEYLGALIPGFEDHLGRADARAGAASHSSTVDRRRG